MDLITLPTSQSHPRTWSWGLGDCQSSRRALRRRDGGLYRWIGGRGGIKKTQESRKAWRSTWLPRHCLSCLLGLAFICRCCLRRERMGRMDLEGEAWGTTRCMQGEKSGWHEITVNLCDARCSFLICGLTFITDCIIFKRIWAFFLKQAQSVFLQDQVGTLAQIQNWPLHHPEKNKALFITAVQ